jgi:hypothetical protein
VKKIEAAPVDGLFFEMSFRTVPVRRVNWRRVIGHLCIGAQSASLGNYGDGNYSESALISP